ncbi:MAG: replication-relaxation family protein [Acidobacteria bacterium]|nr:replication-relaxation family protein [Acidobacteriota bacterium]
MTGNEQQRIVIQDRDRRLLRELAVMRVIDREQAKCVAGFRSTTRANWRLLVLTNAGLLRRFFLGTSGGGKKALYALSPQGANLVNAPFRGPRRRQDEILVADFFVAHQLQINQVFCQVKYRPIPIPESRFVRWVSFHEPLTSGSSPIPDGYFEVSQGARMLAAFLEVDLGHESLRIWRNKVEGYLRYAISGEFQAQSKQTQFHVLVIADSEGRLQSIRRLIASITEKVFWLSTFEFIKRQGFWSPIWLRPKGDQRQALL